MQIEAGFTCDCCGKDERRPLNAGPPPGWRAWATYKGSHGGVARFLCDVCQAKPTVTLHDVPLARLELAAGG